jgi:hypothetical protein
MLNLLDPEEVLDEVFEQERMSVNFPAFLIPLQYLTIPVYLVQGVSCHHEGADRVSSHMHKKQAS